MSKLFQYAGTAASVVLIAFGIGAVVVGFATLRAPAAAA